MFTLHQIDVQFPITEKYLKLVILFNQFSTLLPDAGTVDSDPPHAVENKFDKLDKPVRESKSTSFPGSSQYSKWRIIEDPGTRCQILHES